MCFAGPFGDLCLDHGLTGSNPIRKKWASRRVGSAHAGQKSACRKFHHIDIEMINALVFVNKVAAGLLEHADVDFPSNTPRRLVRCTKLKHLFIRQLFRSHPPTAKLVL